jgi:hypothetical protein
MQACLLGEGKARLMYCSVYAPCGLRVLGLRVYLGFFLWAVLIVLVYTSSVRRGTLRFFFIKFITYQKKKTYISY